MTVRNRLESILKTRGIKKVWLAERVGVTRGTIANVINEKTITLEIAFKIAKVLECDINEIFYYVENE